MKRHGSFRLATQAGGRGYFGRVALEIEAGDSEVKVTFEKPRPWRAAIEFGVRYVCEKAGRRGLQVTVVDEDSYAVDSTELVMAFVAAHALWDALGEHPARRPKLDASSGTFSFPN